ncbi:hypothetical protein BA723_02420 [Helicobacter sp. CLO-3]|uniref:Smr/MutS family protein n=1 Tax=Helicobacter sp. CLO-3 TaxID=211 RepID=UPI000805537B|nr:Smr/MutS family protein [Helicobacter sp. CLO-3]OBV30123.1 hypothetical protein BA723_02420 [Helicobacter sp. CLO-3]
MDSAKLSGANGVNGAKMPESKISKSRTLRALDSARAGDLTKDSALKKSALDSAALDSTTLDSILDSAPESAFGGASENGAFNSGSGAFGSAFDNASYAATIDDISAITPSQYCAIFCKKDAKLLAQLDLESFIYKFASLLARPKGFYLQGDLQSHKKIIDELETLTIPPMPRIPNLDKELFILQKFGTLRLKDIFAFSQILSYFENLLNMSEIVPESSFYTLLHKIEIPQILKETICIFESNGELIDKKFVEIHNIKQNISNTKDQIKSELHRLSNNKSLEPYLVDRQIHLVFDAQTLLLKAGYTHALKGSVLDRSQGGFFYVLPQSIERLYARQKDLQDALEVQISALCKEVSAVMQKHLAFLRFINGAFDRFDLLFARIEFAKTLELEFIMPYNPQKSPQKSAPNPNPARQNHALKPESKKLDSSAESAPASHTHAAPAYTAPAYTAPICAPIILKDFCHPILQNPTPLSIDFSQQLLVLTGVNAGGKTMLLKSILSAAFLAKHLLPMKCNAHHSKIAHFKHICAIISDPQNTKNDISTFAGRMLQFSQNLALENMLLGVDEIELGTDADEAASLYKTLLQTMLAKNNKIIITTHHKRLAALMADDARVQMSAALFDIKRGAPTYAFMHGSIGKSYAFETAQRYGIPKHIISKAIAHYGSDKERLNELIERSSKLEIELKSKNRALDQKIQAAESKRQEYLELIANLKQDHQRQLQALEKTYQDALNTLKKEAKDISDIHRNINNAHQILKKAPKYSAPKDTPKKLSVGDLVAYKDTRGVILRLESSQCLIELDSGMRAKVDKHELRYIASGAKNGGAGGANASGGASGANGGISGAKSVKSKGLKSLANIKLDYTPRASVSLDLHGLRAEEAIEKLEDFISDALIAGFDEVLVYHGIGTGRLAKVVRDVLSAHPRVLSFDDAPPNMGGMGAKIIKL